MAAAVAPEQPPPEYAATDIKEWKIDTAGVLRQEGRKFFWINCIGGPCLFLCAPIPLLCIPWYFACSKPTLKQEITTQRVRCSRSSGPLQSPPVSAAGAPLACTC